MYIEIPQCSYNVLKKSPFDILSTRIIASHTKKLDVGEAMTTAE